MHLLYINSLKNLIFFDIIYPMKIRNIKKTLENFNEAIKYIVFIFTMVIIAGYALFFAHYYVATGELYSTMITDIIIAVILLGLTISSRGSVSPRRTVLMIIFGLFTLYDVLNYAIYLEPILVLYYTQFSEAARILLYCGVAAGVINVLALIFRCIILVQYNVCEIEGIDQLSRKNFAYTFNSAVRRIGVDISNLFIYGLVYQGVGLMITAIVNLIEYNTLLLEILILGLILIIIPIIVIVLIRKYKVLFDKKELCFAAFFAFFTVASIVCMIVFNEVGMSDLLCDLGYTFGISLLAFGYSIYVYILQKNK